jgi:hypothetical protein
MKHTCTILLLALFTGIGIPSTGMAAVDWEIRDTFKTEHPPLDIAGSADAKLTFVLAEGGVLFIYSDNGELKEKIAVDPAMDRIAVSSQGDTVLLSSRSNNTVQKINLVFSVAINIEGSPFLGSAEASVALVVFSDFQ